MRGDIVRFDDDDDDDDDGVSIRVIKRFGHGGGIVDLQKFSLV